MVVEFIKKHSFNIVGLIIGLLGIGLSYYFYDISKIEREPVFIVDPLRTQIIDSKLIKSTPITVLTPNGRKISADLNTIRFYFWNNGRQSIKRDNILKKIRIQIADSSAEILDYRVLSVSRDICQLTVIEDSLNINNSLLLDFFILEQNDGFTCQVIYEGSPNAEIKISGLIEGVSSIITTQDIQSSPSVKDYAIGYGNIIGATLFALFILSIDSLIKFIKWLNQKPFFATEVGKRFSKGIKVVFLSLGAVVLLLVITFFIYLAFVKPYEQVRENAKQSVVQKVPKTIVPRN